MHGNQQVNGTGIPLVLECMVTGTVKLFCLCLTNGRLLGKQTRNIVF